VFSIVCVLIASLNIEIARFEIPVYLSMILGIILIFGEQCLLDVK